MSRSLDLRVADYIETLQQRMGYLEARATQNQYIGTWGARILEHTILELQEVCGSLSALVEGSDVSVLSLAPCLDHKSQGCPRPRHCPEHTRYMRLGEDDPYMLSRRCKVLHDLKDTVEKTTGGPHPGPCIACGGPCHSYSVLCTKCDNFDDMHHAETTSEIARPIHKDHVEILPKTEHHFQQFPEQPGVAWRTPAQRKQARRAS